MRLFIVHINQKYSEEFEPCVDIRGLEFFRGMI